MIFTYKDEIMVDFNPNGVRNEVGTDITIEMEKDPYLDEYGVQNICEEYLQFIPDVKIILTANEYNEDDKYYFKTWVVNENFYREGEIINMEIKKEKFFISDNATGISTDILFNSLLIPSSSSKKILYQKLDSNYIGSVTGIKKTNRRYIYILVGDIPIRVMEDIYFPSNVGIVVQMPANTPLPVSRAGSRHLPPYRRSHA